LREAAPASQWQASARMTGPALIDFRIHAIRTGSDEAGRVDFHRMLSALVGVTHPTATDVRADPGDWGIDVFVGSLVDKVMIWQSKYFYTEIGDSQKAQIRKSFKSAMDNATRYGYTVEAWTLCVACELSAPERRWWDSKVREWKKAHPTVSVDLWDAPRLRRMLMSPDVKPIWNEFYGASSIRVDKCAANSGLSDIPVSMEDTPDYEGTLFVKQMVVAGIQASDAQKASYFNADLLTRDIAARSVSEEVAAIREVDISLLAKWEDAVADPATAPNSDDYQASARRLFSTVMNRTSEVQAPAVLPLRHLHIRGLMHKIVDETRAGWVHDWKVVAAEHDERSASNPSNSQLRDEVQEIV